MFYLFFNLKFSIFSQKKFCFVFWWDKSAKNSLDCYKLFSQCLPVSGIYENNRNRENHKRLRAARAEGGVFVASVKKNTEQKVDANNKTLKIRDAGRDKGIRKAPGWTFAEWRIRKL